MDQNNMRGRYLLACVIFVLTSCSITNVNYRYVENTYPPIPPKQQASTPTVEKRHVEEPKVPHKVIRATPIKPVGPVKAKPSCKGVPFPDPVDTPEPPLQELKSIDPKDKKRINDLMIDYITKLRKANQDNRQKYLAARNAFLEKCQ